MTKRYTGGVISSSLPTVNSAGASGVFLLSQQADAQSRNAWPPFKVEESLRFRAANSAYLNRTPAVAGNRKTFTYSGWLKRGVLDTTYNKYFFSAKPSVSVRDGLYFGTNQTLSVFANDGSSALLVTTQVFRDPAAWYHIVVAVDTTQATNTNRVKVYVNGVQVTAFGTATYPSQNYDWAFNNTVIHTISDDAANAPTGIYHFDGYMSEVNFIDGQQLTPSSFGATDKDGNWSPIAYTGTYGTNGFYVNFRDNTSATTVGYDYSGNGNNWTLNNFNVSTANTSYDIMIDVPSDQSDGTANNRGNYCTFNPVSTSSRVTVSDGNLRIAKDSFADWNTSLSSFLLSSGKWYWEFTLGTTTNVYFALGYVSPGFNYSSDSFYPGRTSNSYAIDANTGNKRTNDTTASYGSTYASNDVVMLAIDLDTKQIWFGKNGQWGNGSGSFNQTFANSTVAFSSIATPLIPAVGMYASENGVANFGQRPFTYTPPSGFKALNTFNLSDPTIKQPNKYFNATLYTGDGTSNRTITGTGFQPDWLWLKMRNDADDNVLVDSVRGGSKRIKSNTTDAESDISYPTLASDGFVVSSGVYNNTAKTFVAWQWNAGGSTVTNTTGTISSQVRANPTAGFSIVTYTGTGSNATIGHGLGATPSMIIVKRRDAGSSGWSVYFTTLSAGYVLSLQSSNGQASSPARFTTTLPTSTVFSIGTDSDLNASGGTYVAYCFAPIDGYSAFGSYIANASSNGPFIHTGFRPKFVMVKRTDAAEGWEMLDTSRNTYNAVNSLLEANLSSAEITDTSRDTDFTSNGFKVRNTSNAMNASGSTYIYMAFAEAPFKYARSR
jgi:hypothetical protein